MPTATRLFIKLKTPKKITTNPAVLKKIPDCAFLWIANELKLKKASTGSVPKANADIINAPLQKLPVVKV